MAQQMPAMPPSGAQAFASAAAPAPAPAPPWHAWACLTSCVVMAVLCSAMAVAYLDIRAEQRETAAHLRTIYMLVPELRELVNKNINTGSRE